MSEKMKTMVRQGRQGDPHHYGLVDLERDGVVAGDAPHVGVVPGGLKNPLGDRVVNLGGGRMVARRHVCALRAGGVDELRHGTAPAVRSHPLGWHRDRNGVVRLH